MRRTLLVVLLLSASTVHSQSEGGQAGIIIGRPGNIAPIAYYAPSGSILDNYGNLIVYDFIYSYPPIMTGQDRRRSCANLVLWARPACSLAGRADPGTYRSRSARRPLMASKTA